MLRAFSFDFAIWKCAVVLLSIIIGIRALAFIALFVVAKRSKLNN